MKNTRAMKNTRPLVDVLLEDKPKLRDEHEFVEELQDLLNEAGDRTNTYDEASILTSNAGLVVSRNGSEFQITVVQTK